MGLIRAAAGALGGTLADQWKEFFYCDAMDKDILVKRGQKRTSSRSANTKGNDNIISNGSGIAVADGQCMLIVEQGKVVEVCAEPGEFTYDSSTEPSIFTGNLGDSIKETFKIVGKRFTYGGDTAKDQRVYYINTKELGEILFGTATPIPFRVVVDESLGYKLSVDIRCNGLFTYKICDPLLFYTNVCGNVVDTYESDEIAARLKGEMMNALQPALAKLSGHDDRVAAEGAGGCRRVVVCHDLAAAGFAVVGVQILFLTVFPGASFGLLPLHVILFFLLQSFIVLLQRFHFKFRITERTFQFLCFAVKTDSASTAGAFVFL